MAKFARAYASVCDLDESGTNEDDRNEKAKIMYHRSSKGNKLFVMLDRWRVLRHAPKWKSNRAITTWPKPRKRWLQPDGNTPLDSMSVQGTVEDVASIEKIPRPLGKKKVKRITIFEAKGARLDLEFNKAIAAMAGYNT